MLLAICGAALTPLGAAPVLAKPASASQRADPAVAAEIAKRADSDFRAFYAARAHRPLWIDRRGISPAAMALRDLLETAERDRLKPRKLRTRQLARALERAGSGEPDDLAKAELALSSSYVAYVKALRAAYRAPMIYESEALAPAVPTITAALQAAASAGSLEAHVRTMGWMHPLYAPLRAALGDHRLGDVQRDTIALNLDRVRAIPAYPADRYVLIDAASARLWMYEDGRPAGSMRVVVGKPDEGSQTPMMAGFIRYAIVNPYWNVPGDLVRSRIAWNVLDKGHAYLRDGGYQVLSDWHEEAKPVDPTKVDWRAVEAGTFAPRVRQLPGGSNFMGKVKFMFPNAQGIYLHDTPDKDLLRKDARQFSSGCVRLEDAQHFGRWLMKKPLPRRAREPEQRLELPEPVPVFITYLTAMPENDRVAFRGDVYGRDRPGGDDARLARGTRASGDRP